tara:strand:- start:943 stop:1197 length:255 start_codon:yes stop_codon:yes gene_type:complete
MIDPEWLPYLNDPELLKPILLIGAYHWLVIRGQIKCLNSYKTEIQKIYLIMEALEKDLEGVKRDIQELKRDFREFSDKFLKINT